MPELMNTIMADGPSSNPAQPIKAQMRAWGTWVEDIITAFLSNGGLIYDTRTHLDADLLHDSNSIAWVLGDATVANNGIYRKIGASGTGSWTRVADLPYSFIMASDAGAGSPNAIVATSSIPVPAADGGALIVFSVFEANTALPVTVAFNGGTPLTIKTSSGANVVAGGLVAGMVIAGYKSGATFRLLTDQVSAAIQAAAEAAATRAELAAASVDKAATGRFSTEFGFVDDGATNNDAAWVAAKAALTHGERLVMVKKVTGIFYFATTSDFTGVPIDATANPTFTGPNVYNDRTQAQKVANDPAVTVVGTGELLFNSTALLTTFQHHAEPVDKFDFLTDGDVAYDEPTVVDMNTATMLKFAWPNGNTTSAAATGISKATNLINIDWSTADLTTLIFAGIVPEPGCQYSWVCGYNAADTGYVVLAYEGGYHAVYAAVGGDMVHKKLTAAATFTETSVFSFGDGLAAQTEAGYTLTKASMTVDMLTPTKYAIGMNGVIIASGELAKPALYIGPGVYRPAAGAQVSNFQNIIKTRNPTRLAPRPVRALFVGDSKMDDIMIGWPRDIARVMQGSMGTQWESSKNIALAGATLADQLTAILAQVMTGYTDVFIGLGTNDTQVGTASSTFATNFALMLDQALIAGAKVTVLLTPAFYDRANAVTYGGLGQNSGGSSAVPVYREIIRRVVATYRDAGKAVAIVDAGKILGPTIARYLTWNADQNRVDLNVLDNIHETRSARTKIAHACARAAYGLSSPKRTSGVKTMLALTSVGGTVAAAATAYLGSYAAAAALSSAITIPYAGVAKNLRCLASVVPGAGQSYTYTLMVNGVATILTCVTGAAVLVGADTLNMVAVAAGASLSVRVVNSATGAVATHQCTVEIDPT
ncbi:SGNH/GDSL hydrolase family protein [Mesorhizobium sp. WSM4310]|uniref:SGNH/GDSL hydrolase family protein n=1 Tax=Mesorhizobium sp. WSM4310 TaxID=2589883 RepID=UPI00115CFF91|nr:SGNH/GDSL hydrolase family protein [Mesorhizobium sp. WSM4310]TRC78503.1 SGNH/GDSL hydrolase family protein [Mesorhizobium sp. WSM4310]